MANARIIVPNHLANAGQCRAMVDGFPCATASKVRGLCSTHYTWALQHARLGDLALPLTPIIRKFTFELKPADALDPQVCRVNVNGTPCQRAASRRGLCSTHYAGIWQREDLDLDAFCEPQPPSRVITLVSHSDDHCCRAAEAGDPCSRPAERRGLCRAHYAYLKEHDPAGFRRIAAPAQRAPIYSLRRLLKPGRCRAAEDQVGCGESATDRARGLCTRHANLLRGRPELYDAIALPASAAEVRPQLSIRAGAAPLCHLVVDRKTCPRAANYRGLCLNHRRQLHGWTWTSPDQYYLPPAPRILSRKPPDQRLDGRCILLEDGVPCQRSPNRRGICKSHVNLASRTGRFLELADPPAGTSALASQTIPHVFLDKNILIDACEATEGRTGQAASVQVVDQVRRALLLGSCSIDALTTAYNHVRYRRLRQLEGGQVPGAGPDHDRQADDHARQIIGEVLGIDRLDQVHQQPTGWRFAAVDASGLLAGLRDRRTTLSLEDALEWGLFQRLSTQPGGPRWFLSRDAGIPGAIHPHAFIAARAAG